MLRVGGGESHVAKAMKGLFVPIAACSRDVDGKWARRGDVAMGHSGLYGSEFGRDS